MAEVSHSKSSIYIIHPSFVVLEGYQRHVPDLERRLTSLGGATSVLQARALLGQKAPDILLTDPLMEEEAGFALVEEVRQVRPECQIILITDDRFGPLHFKRALRAGVRGAFHLRDSVNSLKDGLGSLLHGHRHFSPLLSDCLQDEKTASDFEKRLISLTEKQRKVFELLGLGLAQKQIADKAGMSIKTVESHEMALKQKLGLTSTSELRRLAILQQGRGI